MQQLLKHKVFISTRPKGQSDELWQLFNSEGAEIIEMPCIQIQPVIISDSEIKLFKTLEQFQWLILTSPNGVRHFFRIVKKINGHHKLPESLQIAVIGNKTEKILNDFGYSTTFINPGSTAEEFADAFVQIIKNSQPNILLPLGNLARTIIQDQLKNIASCTRINIYQTLPPDSLDKKTTELIRNGQYEMLIFTSPSGIFNFFKMTKNINPENLRIVCIGKTTAQAAIENNIQPKIIAKMSNSEGIYNSILDYYKIKNH